jgi:hypothetical protein
MPEGQRGRSLRIARIRLHFIQLVFHACLSCDERIQNSTSERIITTNVKRFVQSHRSRVQRVRLACQRYFAKDK